MRATLTILCFTLCIASRASDIVWHTGSVVLADKQVLVGDVARQSAGLLLLKDSKGSVSVYPAHKVSSFRFYDEEDDVNRVFITVANRYFERVVYGKISVLRIQKFFDQDINEAQPESYEYFVEEHKRVSSLKSFRRKYFDRIKEDLDLRFITHRHLDPNTKHGALSLIMLYNQSSPVPVI